MRSFQKLVSAFMVTLFIFSFAACATSLKTASKILPLNDEVLTYPLAFDLTYLRTLEALEKNPEWVLEETAKEQGIIRVRNVNFSSFIDEDKRTATFILKRVSREETSIQLAPESQRVIGGGDLLKLIAETVSREL